MKKIFIGLAVLVLSSCYLKGDYTLGRRNAFNDFFYTYNIRYYDENDSVNSVTETETVSDYKLGVVRHAMPGGVVVSSKTFEKEVYSDRFVRPNMKGGLVSYTVPVEFSDEKVYEIAGEVEIKGVTYRMLKPNRVGDVILIDGNGKVYPRVGRIYNNRLALLETEFLLEPDDFGFTNSARDQSIVANAISGIEIRFVGIQDYRLVFRSYSLQPNGKYSQEQQKTYKFSMYDKEITIEGIKLEILNADEDGIDYKILSM